jgi:hypothetical protein
MLRRLFLFEPGFQINPGSGNRTSKKSRHHKTHAWIPTAVQPPVLPVSFYFQVGSTSLTPARWERVTAHVFWHILAENAELSLGTSVLKHRVSGYNLRVSATSIQPHQLAL